jgi:hypothetical protein
MTMKYGPVAPVIVPFEVKEKPADGKGRVVAYAVPMLVEPAPGRSAARVRDLHIHRQPYLGISGVTGVAFVNVNVENRVRTS